MSNMRCNCSSTRCLRERDLTAAAIDKVQSLGYGVKQLFTMYDPAYIGQMCWWELVKRMTHHNYIYVGGRIEGCICRVAVGNIVAEC